MQPKHLRMVEGWTLIASSSSSHGDSGPYHSIIVIVVKALSLDDHQ